MHIPSFKRGLVAAACVISAMLVAAPAQAGPIVSAVNAVVNIGGPGIPGASIHDTYNHHGLLGGQGYTSGVTDYNTYLGGNPQHSFFALGNEWFSSFTGSGSPSYSVTYELLQATTVDRFALWNEDFAGATLISLFSSMTNLPNSFTPVFGPSAAVNNPNNLNYGPKSYAFAPVNAKYFRLEGSQCSPGQPGSLDTCGIGEVAWRAVSVPEPAGLALVGVSLLGLGLTRRRRFGN